MRVQTQYNDPQWGPLHQPLAHRASSFIGLEWSLP